MASATSRSVCAGRRRRGRSRSVPGSPTLAPTQRRSHHLGRLLRRSHERVDPEQLGVVPPRRMESDEVVQRRLGLGHGAAIGLDPRHGGSGVLEEQGEGGVVVGDGRVPAARHPHRQAIGEAAVEPELGGIAGRHEGPQLLARAGDLGDEGRRAGLTVVGEPQAVRHPHLAGADGLGLGARDHQFVTRRLQRPGHPLRSQLVHAVDDGLDHGRQHGTSHAGPVHVRSPPGSSRRDRVGPRRSPGDMLVGATP